MNNEFSEKAINLAKSVEYAVISDDMPFFEKSDQTFCLKLIHDFKGLLSPGNAMQGLNLGMIRELAYDVIRNNLLENDGGLVADSGPVFLISEDSHIRTRPVLRFYTDLYQHHTCLKLLTENARDKRLTYYICVDGEFELTQVTPTYSNYKSYDLLNVRQHGQIESDKRTWLKQSTNSFTSQQKTRSFLIEEKVDKSFYFGNIRMVKRDAVEKRRVDMTATTRRDSNDRVIEKISIMYDSDNVYEMTLIKNYLTKHVSVIDIPRKNGCEVLSEHAHDVIVQILDIFYTHWFNEEDESDSTNSVVKALEAIENRDGSSPLQDKLDKFRKICREIEARDNSQETLALLSVQKDRVSILSRNYDKLDNELQQRIDAAIDLILDEVSRILNVPFDEELKSVETILRLIENES